jgi:hypothetical protein
MVEKDRAWVDHWQVQLAIGMFLPIFSHFGPSPESLRHCTYSHEFTEVMRALRTQPNRD